MLTTELTYPTTLWTATCEDFQPDELVETMARHLPPDGLTAEPMRGRFHLRDATLRLLDSRILKAALESFNQDIAGPLVSGLGAYQRVTEAARETLSSAEQPEVTVVLVDPYPVTWSDRFEVELSVDGDPVAKFPFRLDVGVNLGETSLVGRKGAIEAVGCELFSLAVSFTFADLTPPLWAREPLPLPLLLHLRPSPPAAVRTRAPPHVRTAGPRPAAGGSPPGGQGGHEGARTTPGHRPAPGAPRRGRVPPLGCRFLAGGALEQGAEPVLDEPAQRQRGVGALDPGDGQHLLGDPPEIVGVPGGDL